MEGQNESLLEKERKLAEAAEAAQLPVVHAAFDDGPGLEFNNDDDAQPMEDGQGGDAMDVEHHVAPQAREGGAAGELAPTGAFLSPSKKGGDFTYAFALAEEQAGDYTYFNPNVLQNWAGPAHWKFRKTAAPLMVRPAAKGGDGSTERKEDLPDVGEDGNVIAPARQTGKKKGQTYVIS